MSPEILQVFVELGNLHRTSNYVSSVGTFVNRLTTSKLTIWIEWIETSLIFPTQWAEFLTYDKDLQVSGVVISTRKWLNGWHAEPRLLTRGLNGIPFLWMFGRPYMCVAYCNVELAVCILFVVWDLYSYQRSVTASFLSSGSGPSFFYNSHHCQSNQPVCWSIPPIHYHSSICLCQLEVFMILLSSCSDLIACLSIFEMFGFGGFDFSSACLTFHLSSSALALGIFKGTSSFGAIRSK